MSRAAISPDIGLATAAGWNTIITGIMIAAGVTMTVTMTMTVIMTADATSRIA